MNKEKSCGGDWKSCQYGYMGELSGGCKYSGYCDYQLPRNGRELPLDQCEELNEVISNGYYKASIQESTKDTIREMWITEGKRQAIDIAQPIIAKLKMKIESLEEGHADLVDRLNKIDKCAGNLF